jgi:hypothetical protein
VDSTYRHLCCSVCDDATIRTDSAIISTRVHVNSKCKMHYPLHVLLKSLNAIIVTVLLALLSSPLPLKVTPLQLAWNKLVPPWGCNPDLPKITLHAYFNNLLSSQHNGTNKIHYFLSVYYD